MTDNRYVSIDEDGVMRVGATRVMLDSVLAGFAMGHSPETIRQQYPALSLEEVYGSIAYSLANPTEVQQYLDRQDQLWGELRERCEKQPGAVVQRLRALRQVHSAAAS